MSETFIPLNHRLYQLVRERLGEVKVANEGAPFEAFPTRDFTRPSGQRLEITAHGESYRVNCCFCGDTRFRLWIGHYYGQPGLNGWPMYQLATCFNSSDGENCARKHRQELADRIFGFFNRGQRPPDMPIRHVPAASNELRLMPWPGLIQSMRDLSLDHHAYRYLVDRGFDPIYLAERWGVGYCEQASAAYGALTGRIFAPIFQHNTFVGWQGRWPADYPKERGKQLGTPKYFTCPSMPKGKLLYNYDRARQWPFIVIQEGITDVWKTGFFATAILGKSFGTLQKGLVLESHKHKPIFLMLDQDALDESARIIQSIREITDRRGLLIQVALPDHDPGYFTPSTNWQILCAAAWQHGLDLQTMAQKHVPNTY
jgi:hypothetical protein